MQKALSILQQLVQQEQSQSRSVYQCPPAPQLKQQLDLSLDTEYGKPLDSLQDALQSYIQLSPDVAQADFYKQLYSGREEAAVLGDWITSLTNSNMHTYQVSPVATLMEQELVQTLNQKVGFINGDGMIVSGGSQANLVAILVARHQVCPDIKRTGMQKPLVAYTSDQAHYSMQKAANITGIGTDNLIAIPSDQYGQMKPEALEQAIKHSLTQGHHPFFISATAGTTVIGAYDDIQACSAIARKYGLWLHIDGAWGAPVLFSEQHKHLLAHSELGDSFTWDAHKLMSVPLTAAFILVKESSLLEAALSGGGGNYLFHNDENAAYNLGTKSLQCGRRADALKVWMAWQAKGEKGYARKVDYLQSLKQHFCQLLENHPHFQQIAPAAYLNILFRYEPEAPLSEAELRSLAIQMSKTSVQQGGAYVDYASFQGKTGLRLILGNDLATKDGLETLLADFERIAQNLLQH